jgi:hypothetical protein
MWRLTYIKPWAVLYWLVVLVCLLGIGFYLGQLVTGGG